MDLAPDLQALLAEARVARLATVDDEGRPHVVPVCFAYRDGVAYIALDAKPKRVPVTRLRRVRNILANPEVQLLIDRYAEDWSRLAYLQLRGRASLIEPGPEHAEALVLLRARYPQYLAMSLEDAPMIRIEVYDLVAWQAAEEPL
jgi:PPOX class probable F420-dependent enzyme